VELPDMRLLRDEVTGEVHEMEEQTDLLGTKGTLNSFTRRAIILDERLTILQMTGDEL